MPFAGPLSMRTSGVSATLAGFQPVTSTHQTRQTSKNASAAARQIAPCARRAAPRLSLAFSIASAPQTAGHIRYIKVGARPSSVERRIIA